MHGRHLMRRAAAWALLATAAGACGGSTYNINMNAMNGSAESGNATFTDNGNGALEVLLTLSNVPINALQPSHIHLGRCATLGSLSQALTEVTNSGNVPQQETISSVVSGKYSDYQHKAYVDVHLSQSQLGTVVSCGDID